MANNKTILKAVERKSKRLARLKNRLRWTNDPTKVFNEIKDLELEILNCKNQIKLNRALHERDKKANRAKQQHDAVKELSRCNKVGDRADTTGDECPW